MLGTEYVFANALLFLAQTQPIKDIKITQLLNRAGAGRQTFYNHFEDKYDLVRWIYSEYGKAMSKILLPDWEILPVFTKLFDFFRDHGRFFLNLDNLSSRDEFIAFLSDHLIDYFSALIVRFHGEAYLTREIIFAIDFYCDGFCHSCWRWMRSDMSVSSDIMAKRMVNNMSPVLTKMTKI